jgi:hypothetical protein
MVESFDGGGRSILGGDIAVAGQERIRSLIGGGDGDEITEVKVLKFPEIGGGEALLVGRAEQKLGHFEFVGERLKVAEAEVKVVVQLVAGQGDFERAAVGHRHLKREAVLVFMGEDMMGQADLPEVRDARDLAAASTCPLECGEKESGEDADDQHDEE